MRTPKEHIRQRGSRYEIAVPAGRDLITKRYRYAYDYADTEEQAERRRAALIEQITKGRAPQARATVSDLIDRWLSVAELELITSVNYESYVERVIRPVLGGLQLREIQEQVEVLDELYAQLRRCRRLCRGRPGLVDHRPVGQGRRRPDGSRTTRTGPAATALRPSAGYVTPCYRYREETNPCMPYGRERTMQPWRASAWKGSIMRDTWT